MVDNEEVILDILLKVADDEGASVDLGNEAARLICQLNKHKFFVTGKILVHVLGILKPANAISQSLDMCIASEVIQSSVEALQSLHANEAVLAQICGEIPNEPPTKCQRIMSKHLGDCFCVFSGAV